MHHLSIHLTMKLKTAYHSTGNNRAWGVDKVLAADPDGRVILPSTTLKGKLRDRAESILRTWGHSICVGPEPDSMCSERNRICTVCQVFGNPRHPSVLRFTNGYFREEPLRIVRTGIAISRKRRATLPGHLYFLETTSPAPPALKAHCEGFFADVSSAITAAALVVLSARGLSSVGAGFTRGTGWVRTVETAVSLDHEIIPDERLEKIWRQWAGEVHVAENHT